MPRLHHPSRTRLPRRPSRTGRPRLVVAVCAALLLAGGASAQSSERITFDFTGSSSISLLGGTIVTPPDGTIDVGRADVYVEATAPGSYVPGGIFLFSGFALGGTVVKNIAGAADISGPFQATQPSSLAGTLAVGQTGGDFASDLLLNMNVQLGCVGTGCSLLGFPVYDVGPSLLSVSFLPVSNLGTPGSAQINVNVPIEVDGVLGSLDLVGTEVARSYIPEPGTFVLVASGLVLLGARRRASSRA